MKRAFASRDMLNIIVIFGIAIAFLMPFCMNIINSKLLKDRLARTSKILSSALSSVMYQSEGEYNCYYNVQNLPKDLNCAEYDSNNNCVNWLGNENQQIKGSTLINKRECELYTDAFSDVIKTAKKCEGDAYKNGCIPLYKGVDDVYKKFDLRKSFLNEPQNKLTNGCEKWKNSSVIKSSASWVLSDDSIILFYGDKPDFSLFALDVNGTSGPNKWGYDLFALHLESDNGGLKFGSGLCEIVEKGGKSYSDARLKVFL